MNPHIEASNPIYRKPAPSPAFEQETFKDLIYDEDGKGHMATFVYEGQIDGDTLKIHRCEVTFAKVLDTVDIEEVIGFFEGRRVVIEGKIEWL